MPCPYWHDGYCHLTSQSADPYYCTELSSIIDMHAKFKSAILLLIAQKPITCMQISDIDNVFKVSRSTLLLPH